MKIDRARALDWLRAVVAATDASAGRMLALVFVAWLTAVQAGTDPWTVYPLDPGFIVNSYTTSYQFSPDVSHDRNGNFVIVWDSLSQDGDATGIFGQRFDSSGAKAGAEFMVNAYTSSDQASPAVSHDSLGNFVVVWASAGQDGVTGGIFGQRFASAGTKLGIEFQINTFTETNQTAADLCHGPAGEFVVVWKSQLQDGSGDGVFGQRFSGSGVTVGDEFQINTITLSDQLNPGVSCDPAGNFVVAWWDLGAVVNVKAQRFGSAGSKLGSEFQVNSGSVAGWAFDAPGVSCDQRGNFVITWLGYDGSGLGVRAQRFDRLGTKLGGEIQVNTHTASHQRTPRVDHDYQGNFVVAYSSDGFIMGYDLAAQVYDSAGNKLSGELPFGCSWSGDQVRMDVAFDPGQRFTVVWTTELSGDGDLTGIGAQRLFHDIPLMAGGGSGAASKIKQLKRDWLVPVYCPP